MNIDLRRLLRLPVVSAFFTAVALCLEGCGRKQTETANSGPPASKQAAPPVTTAAVAGPKSAETNSFAEVTSQLDPGGSLYAYLSVQRWLEGLSAKISENAELIRSLPGMGPSERKSAMEGFQLVSSIIKQSGVESISGIGVSGIALQPGFYRTKAVVHHYPGKGQGYLWSILGGPAHSFDLTEWLPTNTVWAASIDADIPGVWQAIWEQVRNVKIPEAEKGLDEISSGVETASGLKMDELLRSLGGRFGIALTLDPEKKVTLPLPDGPRIQMPDPRLVIAIKVKDDRLFDWVLRTLEGNSAIVDGDDKENGLRMRTLPQPLPIPVAFRPSIARAGEYLWIASHDDLLKQMVRVKAGKTPSLRSSEEYQFLTKNLPANGNQFSFTSDEADAIPMTLQQAFIDIAGRQGEGPPRALIEKLFNTNRRLGGASVGTVGAEGWLGVSHGHQPPIDAFALPAMVAPIAIVAGVTLPALAQAKSKAQAIQCVNNLKQLGLGARIYASDHNGNLPPNIVAMKAEIGTPKILLCPTDPQRGTRTDLDWPDVQPENISYEYSGEGKKDGNDPTTVIFRCRIHGSVCLLDGSVQIGPH